MQTHSSGSRPAVAWPTPECFGVEREDRVPAEFVLQIFGEGRLGQSVFGIIIHVIKFPIFRPSDAEAIGRGLSPAQQSAGATF